MTIAPFRVYPAQRYMIAQQGWVLAETEKRLAMLVDLGGRLRDFLDMLTRRPNTKAGRPQGGGKTAFSESELLTAWERGQRDPEDMVRYLKYRYEFVVYPAERILTPFPLLLAIEPTSVCNLRCPMCSITDPRLSEDRALQGRMDLGLYARIIEEAKAHGLQALVLASRGEPTLHRQLPLMLLTARDAGILDIKVNTNATRLTAQLASEILTADPDQVVFSVDTHEAALYKRLRVGGDFLAVRENIARFHEVRSRDYPQSRTRTRATVVVQTPEQDVEATRAFWLEQGVDEVGINPVRERPHLYEREPVEESTPCSLLWERLYVWWDGTVNPCDADYLSRLSPGRLDGSTTIASIWTGPAMTALRERHARGGKNEASPCSRCEGY